jgi:hypothetical protein
VGRQFYARGRLIGALGGLKGEERELKDQRRRGGLKRQKERQYGAAVAMSVDAISPVLVLEAWNGTKMRRIR